ncbi:hypothetical protein P3L10_034321 [Capsicum annuum]
MASVDPTIYATVAAASTAKLAWDSLHLAYANKSQSSRDYQRIPSQLPITSIKCALSAMSLPLAGATVTSDELVVKILSGLGSDFRDNLKRVIADESFPVLEKLYIPYCTDLIEIPKSFGDIASLKFITVSNNPQLKEPALKIKEYVEEMAGEDKLEVEY